ncbi:hypothetical protein QCA50_020854 [Cerrena zonata]|uniref:Uncharacterized protein n=1 Tax=Cerrena zonata TaxID=2478898 RepID=A0AAW0FHU0_9APHY
MLKTQGDIKQYESSDNLNTSLVEDKPCDEKHIKIEEYESKHLNEAEKTRGVAHIEAIVDTMKDEKRGRLITWVFAISILLTAWAYALDGSTTFNYQPFATSSFNRHSMISTVEIATRIISSIFKDWSVKNWTYYNNTLTLSLCIFGVVAGAIQRITHRYKELQIAGLAIKLIGMGLFVKAKGFDATTALLVMGSLLVGMGGSFSVVGSRVASEASVPHQDLALVISLLSLWSSVGAAIGSAIAAPIWNSKLPDSLREYLPKPVNETLVSTIVEKATFLAGYPYESPVRVAGIKAYGDVTRYLFVPALCIAFIPLFAAFFQTGFYLGDQLNAVEGDQPKENIEALKAWEKKQDVKGFDRVLEFFNRPLKG